jgi:uncharacterized protein (TIGR03790 family)
MVRAALIFYIASMTINLLRTFLQICQIFVSKQKLSQVFLLSLVMLPLLLFSFPANAIDFLQQTSPQIRPETVAVVVNQQDANSMLIGDYYLKARGIPAQNLIVVDIPKVPALALDVFTKMRTDIHTKLSPNIQVIVLMWTTPFAVSCNSITSAITLGFNAKQCEDGCAVGIKNPYFNSASRNPAQDFKLRLSILLPTDSIELAKAIIDRGVLSGFNLNESTAYFLKTSDEARTKPRAQFFPRDLSKIESKKIVMRTIHADSIKDKKDVMFYFTGMVTVPNLNTLNFMPGAVADHLTSTGGILYNDWQMSSLKWLEAGATGTYGTVSEPCNYWQKFPNPKVLVAHYLAGETLVEAYWKSVYWPTQGLILGEPLAAPYYKN